MKLTSLIHCSFILFFLVIPTTQTLGNGKLFAKKDAPPEITSMRAILYYMDQTEILLIQPRISIKSAVDQNNIGWIIPIPGIPEVATTSAELTDRTFRFFNQNTRPEVRYLSSEAYQHFLAFLILFCFIAFPASLVIMVNDKFAKARIPILISLVALVVVAITLLIVLPPYLKNPSESKVEIFTDAQFGIYDVKVITSDNDESLIQWLNQNDFKFNSNDVILFSDYIKKKWSFVAVNLSTEFEEKQDNKETLSEGLATPLILKFESDHPFYPLALSGTGDYDAELMLYLVSDSKWDTKDNLTLRFADFYIKSMSEYELMSQSNSSGIFKDFYINQEYVCRFYDLLTPEEMNKDLIFEKQSNNASYQEEIIHW